MLIHLSRNPNLCELVPRIPSDALNNPTIEDANTPRVCFGPSIARCLRAVRAMCNTIYSSKDYKSPRDKQFIQDINQSPYDQMNIDFMNNALITRKTSGLGYPIWYAYRPTSDIPEDCIIAPTRKLVYDAEITRELWVTCPVKVCRFATILLQSRTFIASHSITIDDTNEKTVVREYDYDYRILPPETLAICDDRTALLEIKKTIEELEGFA